MLTLETKNIGKELHPFRKAAFSLKQESIYTDNTSEDEAKKILKYAPKYIECLQIEHWKDAKLVNTLKRVKKINLIGDTFRNSFSKRWRLVLQNKFKAVRKFQQGDDSKRTLEMSKAFSMILKVRLWGKTPFLFSVLRYLPGLMNLKSLFLEPDFSNVHSKILKRLNSMPKTLSSLKAMKISFFPNCLKPKVSFSSFMEYTNILRALTHLTLRDTSEAGFSNSFRLLPILCPRLVYLELFLWNNNKNVGVLQSLKYLENVEKIVITSQDLLPFLENFTLPPSTKDAKLNLQLLTKSSEERLAKNPRFINFFEQWSHLKNFTSLTVSISKHDKKAIPLTLSIVNLILQKVPTLVNFDLDLDYFDADFHYDSFDSIDLTNIFGTLQRFSNTLQTIQLKFPRDYPLTWPSKQDISFPKLTKLWLESCSISDLEMMKNLLSAVLQNNVEIRLGQFSTNSNQALLDLLQIIRRPPKNSKGEFEIRIEKLDLNLFEEMFEEFIARKKKSRFGRNFSLMVEFVDMKYYDGIKIFTFLTKLFKKVTFFKRNNSELGDDEYDVELDGS